jgi:hypothetical protein
MVDKYSMYMIKLDNPLPGDYHIHVCFIYHCRALTNSLMCKRGRGQYWIKWKGYPHSENTWESESNLIPNARDTLNN